MVGPYEESLEIRSTLPDGWRARLPPDVDAQSVFGHYRASYEQTGSVLVVERSIIGDGDPASGPH